jgi:acetyl esterase/lipase
MIRMMRASSLPLGRKRTRGLALALAALLLLACYWPWVDAQVRAGVVLFSVLDTPVLGDATRLLTPEPAVSDTTVGGSPAHVYEPGEPFGGGGGEPYPAILFVNGTTPEGRGLPEVRRLGEGLARSGFVVFVPDLAGLRRDEISPKTLSATLEAIRAAADHPSTRGRKVSLVGASTGATLSLLAAKDPRTKDLVASVSGLAPFADVRTAVSLATTEHYLKDGKMVPYTPDPFLSYAIARSVVAALPPGKDRDIIAAELSRVDRLDPEPLASLREHPPGDLGHDARAVVRLLANEDPRRVDALYRDLPEGVCSDLEKLSPLAGEGSISAPVELATAPRDKFFPPSESFAVGSLAADHDVTVTEALDHAEPGFDPRELPAFVSLDAFVVRSLREARR